MKHFTELIGLMKGVIQILLIFMIESLAFALPFWFLYIFLNTKLGMSDLGYIDCFSLLFLIKILRYTVVNNIGSSNSESKIVVIPPTEKEEED